MDLARSGHAATSRSDIACESPKKQKFVVFAKGSRGDVQPAVALVCALRAALRGAQDNKRSQTDVDPAPEPTIVLVTESFAGALYGELLAEHQVNLVLYNNKGKLPNDRAELFARCGTEPSLGSSVVRSLRSIHEFQVALDACGSDTTCIVFSLFSLDIYPIAERLGCTAILYSP
jgi:hypothetical protein